jgi:hypothetical protein
MQKHEKTQSRFLAVSAFFYNGFAMEKTPYFGAKKRKQNSVCAKLNGGLKNR